MILCIILLAIWMSLIFQTTIILGHNRFTFISVWLLIYHTRWEWYRIMVMKPSTLEGSGRQIPKHRSAPQATEIRRLGMQGEPILPGLEANMRSAFHIVLWVDTIPHPNLSSKPSAEISWWYSEKGNDKRYRKNKSVHQRQLLPYNVVVPEDAGWLKWWQGKPIHLRTRDHSSHLCTKLIFVQNIDITKKWKEKNQEETKHRWSTGKTLRHCCMKPLILGEKNARMKQSGFGVGLGEEPLQMGRGQKKKRKGINKEEMTSDVPRAQRPEGRCGGGGNGLRHERRGRRRWRAPG